MFLMRRVTENEDGSVAAAYEMSLGNPFRVIEVFSVLDAVIPKEEKRNYLSLYGVLLTDEKWYRDAYWEEVADQAEEVLEKYEDDILGREEVRRSWPAVQRVLSLLVKFGRGGGERVPFSEDDLEEEEADETQDYPKES